MSVVTVSTARGKRLYLIPVITACLLCLRSPVLSSALQSHLEVAQKKDSVASRFLFIYLFLKFRDRWIARWTYFIDPKLGNSAVAAQKKELYNNNTVITRRFFK